MADDPTRAPALRDDRTPLPREVCEGALLQVLFEGQAPSEHRLEALLDRLGRLSER